MVKCRYNSAWPCTLAKKKETGAGYTVDPSTCELCLKAKEITKASAMLESAMARYGEIDRAIRTMNAYTGRLTRALEKLEASS